MNEVMNYIFKSVQRSEKRLNVVARNLTAQKKINNSVARWIAVVTAYIVVDYKHKTEMSAKIRKLEYEIDELMNEKESTQCDD